MIYVHITCAYNVVNTMSYLPFTLHMCNIIMTEFSVYTDSVSVL